MRAFAEGEHEDAAVLSFLRQLGQRAADAEDLVIGVRAEDEDGFF